MREAEKERERERESECESDYVSLCLSEKGRWTDKKFFLV